MRRQVLAMTVSLALLHQLPAKADPALPDGTWLVSQRIALTLSLSERTVRSHRLAARSGVAHALDVGRT